MDDGPAHGYVLTLQFEAARITEDVADRVVRDLAHLSAVRGPAANGQLLVHCTVSAMSEGDAVRYAANRTVGSLLAVGVESPRVVSIEACLVDHVAV